jgi:hypothetical protein
VGPGSLLRTTNTCSKFHFWESGYGFQTLQPIPHDLAKAPNKKPMHKTPIRTLLFSLQQPDFQRCIDPGALFQACSLPCSSPSHHEPAVAWLLIVSICCPTCLRVAAVDEAHPKATSPIMSYGDSSDRSFVHRSIGVDDSWFLAGACFCCDLRVPVTRCTGT